MRWFKKEVKPAKPHELIKPLRIKFIGEQAGPVEDNLKTYFSEVFTRTPTVQSAYLARLSYGDDTEYSVGLCIRSSIGFDEALDKQLSQIFANIFREDEHLDILFMREEQEVELGKVCEAFYKKG